MTTPPGRIIGRYRLLDRLGAGGMGEVYLAEDPALGRRVAIKRVAHGGASAEALARLRREAQAAARLSHPGVAAVYDVVEQDGIPYVVMEYVPGDDLTTRLLTGPNPVEDVVTTGVAVAEALAAAHAQGVIHRDLKPSNIRVTPDGRFKILDFGISKVLDPLPAADAVTDISPALTGVGESLGTPGYSAPEQLLGQAVDARADVFSLGVTLYELATGQAPFKRDTALASILASMQQPPPRADTLNHGIPPSLAAVLNRAMAPAPADRFPSVEAFAAALREAASSDAASVDGSTARRVSRWHRMQAVRWGVVTAGLIAAVALLVFAVRSRGPAAPARPDAGPGAARVVAILPPANLSGDEDNDYLAVGLGDSLFTDLSGLPGIRTVSPADVRADEVARGRDPAATARRVGADFLVEASVQRAGEQLRINARLLDAGGAVRWRDDLQGRLGDVFDLQRRFAHGVIAGLGVTPTSAQRAAIEAPATSNVEALSAYWRGRTLLERADVPAHVDDAVATFQRAIELDPSYAEAHAGLAEAWWARYGHTGDTAAVDRAVAESERALALDPGQPRVWVTLALVRNGTGQSDEALTALRRAIALEPVNDDPHRLLGDVLAGRGDWAAAEDAYRKAIALRPGYWRNPYRLGVLFYRTGDFDAAIDAFRASTRLEPEAAAGYQAMGTAMQAAGDLEGARAQYEQAIRIGPTRNAYSNLGIIHYWEGRYAQAAAAFRDALARYPGEAVFHRNLGDALARMGDAAGAAASYGVAATLYERRLTVNPEDAVTLADLAVVDAKRGRLGRARDHIARAVAGAPADADVLYSHAVVLSLAGEAETALGALLAALDAGASPLAAEHDDDLAAVRALPGYRPTDRP